MKNRQNLLISELREDSREKLTSISKRTKIPVSTLYETLKQLRKDTILRNTVLLNFTKMGFHTRAHIILKVLHTEKEELRRHLYCHDNVNNVFKINNGFDFIIETVHKNIKELDDFIEVINRRFCIESLQLHYLIDDVKREGFVVR